MIIVEGPDGSGKTTLVKRLAEELGYPVAPRVVGTDTNPVVGVDLNRWVEGNLKQGFHKTIYDRHRLISDPIYSSLIRQRPGMTSQSIALAEGIPLGTELYERACDQMRFKAIHPLVIVCLPPLADYLDNLAEDPANTQLYLRGTDLKLARQVWAAYFNWMVEHYFHIRHWDYTLHTEQPLMMWVKSMVEAKANG